LKKPHSTVAFFMVVCLGVQADFSSEKTSMSAKDIDAARCT
jgi:hypothetical protein